MFVLARSGFFAGFSRCLSTLVTLRPWRNLRCKNLAKTRDCLSSHLQLVPAPFSRFFIANTLHHRLLIWSLAIARRLCDWFACMTRQPCDWLDPGSAQESGSALAGAHFRLPTDEPASKSKVHGLHSGVRRATGVSPALRERAGVRVSPDHPPHQALLQCALRQAAYSLYRSTPSMQTSGVHRISPIIDNFDRFTTSVALNGVLAARTTTTRSPREPFRYVLRSC